jgi:hypothetical protein
VDVPADDPDPHPRVQYATSQPRLRHAARGSRARLSGRPRAYLPAPAGRFVSERVGTLVLNHHG